MKRIYLDNNATTGIDPRVLDAMLVDLSPIPGNPSSVHQFGQEAKQRLIRARSTIADYLGVKPNELIFTSGGTESLNSLIQGLFGEGCVGHILTSDIEHSSVYNCVKRLEKRGCSATYLSPGLYGAVTLDAVKQAIRKETRLIVLGAVNSETGVKNPIEAIGKLAKESHIPFIVDAVALLGKEAFTLPAGVSGMAFSGHKLHAPKGIGLTWMAGTMKIEPLLLGGDQERARRAGTENLSGILGLAKAVELLKTELPAATVRMQFLRDKLEQELKNRLGNLAINGEGPRICNTSSLSFIGCEGEELLFKLDQAGIAVSHGSACASGALEPSRVLTQMGLPPPLARASLRFSLSRMTTEEEIDATIRALVEIVPRLRK